jgi:hypothetical protein
MCRQILVTLPSLLKIRSQVLSFLMRIDGQTDGPRDRHGEGVFLNFKLRKHLRIRTQFWLETLKGVDYLPDLRVDGRISR